MDRFVLAPRWLAASFFVLIATLFFFADYPGLVRGVAMIGFIWFVVPPICRWFRGDIDIPRLLAVAALLVIVLPSFAVADTLTVPVDLTSTVNDVLQLATLALAAAVTFFAKRGVTHLETLTGYQLAQLHGPAVDDAVSWAAGKILAQLESIADPALKLTVKNGLLASAAQSVVTLEPVAVAALGLTPDTIAAKVDKALGDLMPAPAAATPVTPAPAAPATATPAV